MDPSSLQLIFIISLLLLVIILLSSIKICKVPNSDTRSNGLHFIDKEYQMIAENFDVPNIKPLGDIIIQNEEKLVKQAADQETQNIRLRALDARITSAENVAKSLQLM
jgi:hypothetical protein